DGHVPLAIGTQTGGSVIRPAAFCGVAGFKPSFDAIPTEGVLVQSPTLDTIGVFAGDLGGAALLADALMTGATGLAEAAGQGAGTAPTVAFVRPPSWSEAHVDTQRAFAALSHALGGQMVEMALPTVFEAAADRRADINAAEMAACFAALDPAGLSAETTDMMARGRAVLATDYLAALSLREVLTAALQPIFAKADAILCPAALGPAPEGLSSTGSAIFNGLWTYCGVPAVTLPGLLARGGLPLGLQLVGPRGGDAALMRTAAWLERWIAAHRDAVSPASLRMA
ncbi:MAG: amidase, partial [Pseudomonadota bacterium]